MEQKMRKKNKKDYHQLNVDDHLGVKVIGSSPVSPQNRTFFELGKSLLLESLSVNREFSKFMISVSTGSIPVYLGVLTFIFPEDYRLGFLGSTVVVSPALFFLLSALMFVMGFNPTDKSFSLEIIEEIRLAYEKTLKKQSLFIKIGLVLFFMASIFSIGVVVVHLGSR